MMKKAMIILVIFEVLIIATLTGGLVFALLKAFGI